MGMFKKVKRWFTRHKELKSYVIDINKRQSENFLELNKEFNTYKKETDKIIVSLKKDVDIANDKLSELGLIVKIDEKMKKQNLNKEWLNGEYDEKYEK